MGSPCKVVLVDDHKLFRDGLKYVLGQDDNIRVIAEASDGIEFLDILNENVPDIVLMDISMPRMNGIEATSIAVSKHPELKIIALSMFGEETYYYKMLQAGAKGFVLKDSGFEELIKAINKVLEGENYFSSSILSSLIKSRMNTKTENKTFEKEFKLSKQELKVLALICEGYSNKEIAEKLSISHRTIEGNRSSLLSKTGSKDSVNLALFALKNKLLL